MTEPRRRHSSAHGLAFTGTWTQRLELLTQDLGLSADELAAVAPAPRDLDAPRELVLAVLAHPSATGGVVSASLHDSQADG